MFQVKGTLKKRYPPVGGRSAMAVDPFEAGSYVHMEQLEVMDSCTPSPETPVLPERWARINTPLKAEEWEWEKTVHSLSHK